MRWKRILCLFLSAVLLLVAATPLAGAMGQNPDEDPDGEHAQIAAQEPEQGPDFGPRITEESTQTRRAAVAAPADSFTLGNASDMMLAGGGRMVQTDEGLYFLGAVDGCVYCTDGETTRWVSVLSQAEGSAFGKRVLRSRRGKWETVFFQREALANNCLASRGLAHICAPDQGLAKCLKDFANDNAIVGSLPSVKAKGARVRNVVLEPFGTINMGQSDDVAFMQPPAYPAAAKEMVKAIRDDLYAFLGLSNGETDVSTRTNSFTAFMLSQFAELYRRLVESAQDYASDAALASVTGEADTRGLRHEDLDGDFQLTLKFPPPMLVRLAGRLTLSSK